MHTVAMYFVTANTGSPTEARSAVIEEIVHGSAAEFPFARCELGGDPDVLGYYYTQQQFVARVALAVFPSAGQNSQAEIIAGSFCDWRVPDVERLERLANTLHIFPLMRNQILGRRMQYWLLAQRMGVLPEYMYGEPGDLAEAESLCVREGWPSAIFTLETVKNDSSDTMKPELATLYTPAIATPELGLFSLRRALDEAKS